MIRELFLSFCIGLTSVAESTRSSVILRLSSYGAKGDGITDDAPAFQRVADFMAAKQSYLLLGEPGKTYILKRGIFLNGNFRLNLRGGTIKPVGPITNLFFRGDPKEWEFAVGLGLEANSKRLTLSDSKGLQKGDYVRFRTQGDLGLLLPSYRRIQRVQGNQVHLSSGLPYRYPSLTTMNKIHMTGICEIRNATIDGSAWVRPNAALFVGGYDLVRVENLIVTQCSGMTANWLVPKGNRKVAIKNCQFLDNSLTVTGQCINVWDSESVTVTGNKIRGTGFGIAIVRCDNVLLEGNDLIGDAALNPSRSVRGIKVVGCYGAIVRKNTIRQYTTAIKAEDSGRLLLESNRCLDSAPGDPTSYAIGVANQNPDREYQSGHRIIRNEILGSGGSGIYLGAGSPACVVTDNQIRNVGTYGIAIFTDMPGDHRILRNKIDTFDNSNQGMAGIYLGASAVCIGNEISDPTGKKMAIHLGLGLKGLPVNQNRTPKGNPLVEDTIFILKN